MPAAAPVQINVTPLFAQGNEVICDIPPPSAHQMSGMIRLRRGNAYTLEFVLQPGNPANLRFDPSNNGANAFWCAANDCPRNASLDAQYINPRVSPDGLRLTVDVVVQGGSGVNRNAVHYRLNFNNGGYYDPIIIHD